ncbi:MAG: SGNH/GDSL hydrolase family protein [Candidatus Hydrogenedentes bacterium]|nr:SGNH/GDSL hydrolase family protein [Candidatus Hydrogenedentota bacterium]
MHRAVTRSVMPIAQWIPWPAQPAGLRALTLAMALAWTVASSVHASAEPRHATGEISGPGAVNGTLPKVLIIGDSISIGYTDAVRERLETVADVRRIPGNGQSTDFGLENIDAWLGAEKWDVIHFNWGIWDTHLIEGTRIRNTTAQYRENLRRLVERLKATGANLVWASTTPIAFDITGDLGVESKNTPIYNGVARSVMREFRVPVDDLYRRALPRLEALQTEDGVHFTPEGSEYLADSVARSIQRELHARVTPSLPRLQAVRSNARPRHAPE